jgi:hypothetical protein
MLFDWIFFRDKSAIHERIMAGVINPGSSVSNNCFANLKKEDMSSE